ncbi:MAG: undecaprenyl-diphosphate phosphatase [Candidatus Heimdallarchaeota archaeon]|nr:undecaprenyl-diphosphate phosphatase [Candidatus Heimdallarchaeota archaeon]
MILFYILLGIIQGILEWLPVSSEGQLVLIALWLEQTTADDALTLAFWLHLGTMTAVLWVFRKEWIQIIDIRQADPEKYRSLLIITTIGTALIGIPIKILLLDLIDVEQVALIFMWIIAISLLLTGGLLYYSRRDRDYDDFSSSLSDLSLRQQFLVGCAQGLTIIPGISRSGTTVSALLLCRQDTESAFRGSFLMAVPASLGSVVLDLLFAILDDEPLIGDLEWWGILIAIFFAFIFGVLTMHSLIRVARKYNFAVITSSLGIFVILFLIFL